MFGTPPWHRVARRWSALARLLIAASTSVWATPEPEVDTLRQDGALRYALFHGRVDGHLRLFTMGTVNRPGLSDHYAGAFGGSVGYHTARWHGWRLRLMAGSSLPLFASELKHADDPDLMPSRYELGLFDARGQQRHTYAYIQELHADYSTRDQRWRTTLGRRSMDQPFLNGQDSRMHPTLFDGATVGYHPRKDAWFEVGWIHHVSPRSTLFWYPVGRSIGTFPGQGYDTKGRPSAYSGQLTTAGIFTATAEWKAPPGTTVTLHDLLVEGIFNTTLLQLQHQGDGPWRYHLRAIRQDAVGDGGHAVDSLAYMPRGASSNIITGRVERMAGPWSLRLNGTRITAAGRFLMPREWGREPLYTFLSRERNEGLGDVWATSASVLHEHPRIKGLRTEAAVGLYQLGSAADVALNKYRMVSYGHTVLDVRYAFHGRLKGMELRLLYVYKWPLERAALTVAQVYNRVDMHHASVVLDHRF